jgi:hypothetical protein
MARYLQVGLLPAYEDEWRVLLLIFIFCRLLRGQLRRQYRQEMAREVEWRRRFADRKSSPYPGLSEVKEVQLVDAESCIWLRYGDVLLHTDIADRASFDCFKKG